MLTDECRRWLRTAGNGEGRRGPAGNGTSHVSWGEKNPFGGVWSGLGQYRMSKR